MEPLCGLRITDRLELVARLLRGPRRLYARRTLLAACGLDQARRNHARRAIFGPLRGRLRPSEIETPRLPQWPFHGPPKAATAVVLPLRDSVMTRGLPPKARPETRFLKPCHRVAYSGDRPDRWKRGRGTPSVTSPRPGYVGEPRPTVQHAPQGPPPRRAPGLGGTGPLSATPRPAPDPGPAAGNRRPTWLILPVAYACLKD